MEKCSYPKCTYIADIVTNSHCIAEHGITKKEIIKSYGAFKYQTIHTHNLNKNLPKTFSITDGEKYDNSRWSIQKKHMNCYR